MVRYSGAVASVDASDVELLGAWRAGQQEAGDTLVKRYYGAVLRFFELRTRAAEDLTQRTFLACVESRERIRDDSSFRAYLFGIARRLLFRHLQDRQRDDDLSSFDAPQPAPGTSVSMLVARREEHQLLLQALTGMSQDAQSLLALYYWEDLSTREIAEVLEVSVTSVTTKLARTRQQLGERIERLARSGRLGAALLGDLDGWVKSLAVAAPRGIGSPPRLR